MPAAKSVRRRTTSAARVRELLLDVAFALHATRVVGRRGVPASKNESTASSPVGSVPAGTSHEAHQPA